jgi:Protein of unknown function (DUF3300)
MMLTSMMRVLAVALAFVLPRMALAQTPPPAQPAAAPAQQQQLLNNAQLDALVAPIALYPDALLAEVLMASTYPLEAVEADRWADANKNLKGDALKDAVDKQSWDDSVKSLTATPDVLDMMSNQLSWTQQLGDAVLAQQPDVMDAIQRLRSKAQANNKLTSNKQQTVTTQQESGRQVIVIQPTEPDTMYVPYYDPSVVYGAWPYPDYPAYPYYWPAPGYIAAGVIGTGIAFGAGYALGRWVSNGNRWGGGFNWGNNNINVNRTTNINNIGNNNNWTHNPAHRQGVRYNNANVATKFGGDRANIAGGAQNRMDFRGRSGQQVLNPGAGNAGNRPNVGGGNGPGGGNAGANRPGGGNAGANRPSGGNAGANRPGGGNAAANRPSTGNRPSAGNRPSGGGGGGGANARPAPRASGGGAMGNISSGRTANIQSARGAASLGGGGGGAARMGGGGGGGGARMGGGGGGGGARGGGGGGGRRSDIRLKHDIVLIGHLDNGLGFYRFAYNGDDKAYVGVMAQEVQAVRPDAVTRGRDGYLRVYYEKLGVTFESYDAWIASGARMPVVH